MKFLSIDVETTGLDPNTHRILEVAICEFDSTDPEIRKPVGRIVLLHPENVTIQSMPKGYSKGLCRLLFECMSAMDTDWFRAGEVLKVVEKENPVLPGLPTTLYAREGFLHTALLQVLEGMGVDFNQTFTLGGKNIQFDLGFLKAEGAFEEAVTRLSWEEVMGSDRDLESLEAFIACVGDKESAEALLAVAKGCESDEEFIEALSNSSCPREKWSKPWRFRCHRRFLDAGNFWVYHEDTQIPSLEEVRRRAGIEFPQIPNAAELHSAVLDCLISGLAIAKGLAMVAPVAPVEEPTPSLFEAQVSEGDRAPEITESGDSSDPVS